jgi:ribose transport system substrate-binding protein
MATAEEKSSRQESILRMIEEDPSVTAQDLADSFGVSLGTVRNDLVALEEMGNIRRSYGRIELLARRRRDSLLVIPDRFSRTARNYGSRILTALALIDRIFLDDSEASHYVALNLPDAHPIHVLTNSIRVAATLAWRDYPGEITILPGAVQRRDLSVALDLGDLLPRRYRVGAAFCSIAALDEAGACYVASRAQLELIRVVSRLAETLHLHVRPEDVGRSDLHVVPVDEYSDTLTELLIDDSAYAVVKSMQLDALPVVVVGDDYSLTGPFNRRLVVGFSSADAGREYAQLIQRSIEDAARATGGIELVVADNHGDRETTLRNLDTFIQHDAKVVLEYSFLEEIGPLAAEKLSHSGITLIGVDNPIPGSIYYGVNNYEAGFVAGAKAADYVEHEWADLSFLAVLVDMAAHNKAVVSRLQGIEDQLHRRLSVDDDRILRITTENELGEAISVLRTELDRLPPDERVLIFGFNAVASYACAVVINDRADRDRFAIVGQNVTYEIKRELIRPDTRFVGTVNYQPELYGPRIMDLVRSILNGESVGHSHFTNHEWVPASRLTSVFG